MQVVDACLCDPLVSRLPGACTPEVTTALAEPKGGITSEVQREVRCSPPLIPGARGEASVENSEIGTV